MDIRVLDSWKEFDTTFVLVRTAKGAFILSKGRISYAIEGTYEHFEVQPCRVSQKCAGIHWKADENLENAAKSFDYIDKDLSRIRTLTGVDPFELVRIVEEKEK